MKKVYIISDEILIDNQKWICDRLKDQFIQYYPDHMTDKPEEADYIWYIASFVKFLNILFDFIILL